MAAKKTQVEQVAENKSLADGVEQFFVPANVTITVAGVSTTSAAMEAAIQSRVTALNARITAKVALTKAIADCDTVLSSTQPVVDAVKQVAVITYANQPATLTVFGLTPKKPRAPLTLEEKADQAAKAKATRIARNTMGPKAKAKVKGVVATPAVTPPGATNGPTTTHS